jgi:TPR repeat protein
MKNPAQAHPWVRRACDLRNAQACAVMGEAYERGYGMPVDYVMAGKLYDFSCSAGDGDACCSYGRMIVDGRGVPRDIGRAESYFDRGCQMSSGLACTDAGIWTSKPFLQTGRLPNLRTALEYYEKACELKDAIGCNNLGGFYEGGYGTAADTFRAQLYFERACKLGREESCANRDRVAKQNSAKDVNVYIHHRR